MNNELFYRNNIEKNIERSLEQSLLARSEEFEADEGYEYEEDDDSFALSDIVEMLGGSRLTPERAEAYMTYAQEFTEGALNKLKDESFPLNEEFMLNRFADEELHADSDEDAEEDVFEDM